MAHETAWQDVQKQLGEAGPHEVLVGLPTFNNAGTAEQIAKTVQAGLSKACPQASVLVVNADAGSQDGTPEILKQAFGQELRIVSIQHLPAGFRAGTFGLPAQSESGVPGREQAFRAFFAVAEQLQTKACIVLDANVRSMTADWVEALLHPVLDKNADLVAPVFRRPRYEGSLTNCIVYPVNRALYGKRLRYQSGGGYGISGKLASLYLKKNVWEGEGSRFGVDSWLAIIAVAEGYDVHQAFLGTKLQDAKAGGADLATILAQAVGAVFFFMEQYQDVWEGKNGSTPVVGPPYEPGAETGMFNVERMVGGFRQGLRDLLPIWEIILSPDTLAGILPLGLAETDEFRFPMALWVQTIYDFALAYHEKVLHRDHLLKSLAPLYLGRTASFILETRDGGPEDVERAIEALCQTFEAMKPYLAQRWRFQ